MASQLVGFPAHHLPPLPPMEASPLLDNSLLQRSFLLQHILMPTLYATLRPEAFQNSTRNERFQSYLAKNNKVIESISQNLTDIIKRNRRKRDETYEENKDENCRKKRNLGYSLTASQDALLDLQDTLTRKMLNRVTGKEVEDLLESMLIHIDLQKKSLLKMKLIQIEADEKNSRKRRTATRCKKPFFPVGHECFYVGHQQKLGWHEAKAACHKLHAHLAEPDNPMTLVKALKKISGHFNRAWIGGSDEEEEGNWKWLSGRSLNGSPYWRPGQPSNHSSRGAVQHCLVILRHTEEGNPPLADFACWSDRAYVCETSPEC